ncbi:MAG TPA: outer membrane beta-barrel protein [Acidobacteriaceae bacterium]|nr:outer membrane beta-barrel protein [Acidobacteriaceae bacterium]
MIASTHRGTRLPRPRRTGIRALAVPCWLLGLLLFVLAASAVSGPASAQSMPTADRAGDLQLGAGFVFAKSNYNFDPIHLLGGAAYVDFARRPHWGGEFIFHQAKDSADATVYERTYEIGPRFFLHRGRLVPYAKVLYGRGVYNFHANIANVAYNMYTGGAGFDFAIRPSINIRADYEYQTWMGFPITNLHPNVFTLGVAYHFHE